MKAVLRGKFIAVNSIRKTEQAQINLVMHLKFPEEREQSKPKANTRKKIIKIRAEINKIETLKKIQRTNELKS